MQRQPLRNVWRALAVGFLVAGVAAGAGCSKRSDNDSGSTASGGGMAPPQSAAPSNVPGNAPASGAAGAMSGGMSAPGAASAPGASGG
ncbi:hypothetical protein [Burkholderia stagnalis]